jgi:CheY-like chemotaxis protein
MPTVLVVDDDPKLLKMLQRTLFYENLTLTPRTGWKRCRRSPRTAGADHPRLADAQMDGVTLAKATRRRQLARS